jgi:hypothetical protein
VAFSSRNRHLIHDLIPDPLADVPAGPVRRRRAGDTPTSSSATRTRARSRTLPSAANGGRRGRSTRVAAPAARDPAAMLPAAETATGAEPGAAGAPFDSLSAAEVAEPTTTTTGPELTDVPTDAQMEDATTDESTTVPVVSVVADAAAETAPVADAARGAATRGRGRQRAVPRRSALTLDLDAVADVAGLAQEVALLRASIRRLAQPDEEAADHVKVLAELRHQVEALCTALKTQQALEGHGDARAADLARVLDELGDQLGVPR